LNWTSARNGSTKGHPHPALSPSDGARGTTRNGGGLWKGKAQNLDASSDHEPEHERQPSPRPSPIRWERCQALWGWFMVSQTLDLGDGEDLLRVHPQVADGLATSSRGTWLSWPARRASPPPCSPRRPRRSVATGRGVAAAKAVCAQRHQPARHPGGDLVGDHLHVVTHSDEDAGLFLEVVSR